MPLKDTSSITLPPKTGGIVWKEITRKGRLSSTVFFASIALNDSSLKDNLDIWIYRGHFLYPKGWCFRCPKMNIDIDVLYADFDDVNGAAQEAIDIIFNRASIIIESINKLRHGS